MTTEGESKVAELGAPFTVLVDDNFHYQDSRERYTLGKFDKLSEAVAACEAIVDEFLEGARRATPGIAGHDLLDTYKLYGEDPYILPAVPVPDPEPLFSAWNYARDQCGIAPIVPRTFEWWRDFD